MQSNELRHCEARNSSLWTLATSIAGGTSLPRPPMSPAIALADTPSRGASAASTDSWSAAQRASIVEVGFGGGVDFPQYAAFHTDRGFLRLNYGRESGWGTSVIVLPSFWEAGRYCQGARISVAYSPEVTDFVISFSGSISGLRILGEVRLAPPTTNLISCTISVATDGDLRLDRRPGETFKPVVLSSMHVSTDQWDAELVEIDSEPFRIPESGWIVRPAVIGNRFALRGGSSTWKTHAPSVQIELDRRLEITGWKTDSSNPNDDNLAVWAATDRVLPCWTYTVTATARSDFAGSRSRKRYPPIDA
jgi:hypothetical protein